MPAFLLTWNPKHFSTGGDGSANKTLDYAVGEEVDWSCNSQQPRTGDRVYLIRLGTHQHPKGIIASGTVTQESFKGAHWSDASKQKSYIKFQFDDLRQTCEEGLLSTLLLKWVLPDQKWSPQSSGIEIKAEYQDELEELWESGRGQHTLAPLLHTCFQRTPNQSWVKSYRNSCERINQIREGSELNEDDLKAIWQERFNGVTSVKGSYLSEADFEGNLAFLHALASQIIADPSAAMLQSAIQQWNEKGDFAKTKWSVIKRAFAMADPEHLSLLINHGKYLKPFCLELKRLFQIEVPFSDNWCEYNTNLLETLQSCFDESWDCFERNIALWKLYELVKGEQETVNPARADHEPVAEAIEQNQEEQEMKLATNTILYGPPGTGKTYHTIDAAVEAADPDFENAADRSELKARYEQLVADGRIDFENAADRSELKARYEQLVYNQSRWSYSLCDIPPELQLRGVYGGAAGKL